MPPKRKPKAPMDPRMKRMKQMSRALGIDIEAVAKMMEQQEAAEIGLTEAASSEASAASVSEPSASSNPLASIMADLTGKAGAASGTSATPVEEVAAEEKEELVPGTVLLCGGTDWENTGKGKAKGGESDLVTPHKLSLPKGVRIGGVYSGCVACHSIMIDMDGNAWAWGRNSDGQCGLGHKKPVAAPTKLKVPGKKFLSASCGKAHTALVTAGGVLYTMGKGSNGQLGNGKLANNPVLKPAAVALPGNLTVSSAACGGEFTVVLTTCGRIFACGHPEYGQLGNGSDGQHLAKANKLEYDCQPNFTEVSSFVKKNRRGQVEEAFEGLRFTKIACGRNHCVAVERKPGNRVFSWGFGGYGRLGHRDQQDESTPRLIESFGHLQNFEPKSIQCGAGCSMLLSSLGHLYYWGKLPNAPRGEATMYPVVNQDLGGWMVSCMAASNACVWVGAETSCISWGQATNGELGYGTEDDAPKTSRAPRKVDPLEGGVVLHMAMGYAHTLLVMRDSEDADKEVLKTLPEL